MPFAEQPRLENNHIYGTLELGRRRNFVCHGEACHACAWLSTSLSAWPTLAFANLDCFSHGQSGNAHHLMYILFSGSLWVVVGIFARDLNGSSNYGVYGPIPGWMFPFEKKMDSGQIHISEPIEHALNPPKEEKLMSPQYLHFLQHSYFSVIVETWRHLEMRTFPHKTRTLHRTLQHNIFL